MVIMRFGAWCHQYADDTQLCFSVRSHSADAATILSWYLDAVTG